MGGLGVFFFFIVFLSSLGFISATVFYFAAIWTYGVAGCVSFRFFLFCLPFSSWFGRMLLAQDLHSLSALLGEREEQDERRGGVEYISVVCISVQNEGI